MGAPKFSLLDRAIGWVAPATGLRRALARNAIARVRAYEGASVKDGWIPRRGGASANADHSADSRMLRARARSLVQNNPYAAKALSCLVANVVGEGILPASRATDDKTRAMLDALWLEWMQVSDADGGTDFHGLEAQAYRAMEQDGEVLIRLRARTREDGLPVPLQIQILEIDYLDSSKNGNGTEGGIIISGVELNALGRVCAYWLYDAHPGDTMRGINMGIQSKRYAADRIIHLFAPDRPGQARGISRFAPVIARLRDLAIYEDAELSRKQNEALMSVFVSGDGADFAVQAAGQTQSSTDAQAALGNLGTLQPGAIMATNGQTVTIAEPKAAPGYADYIRMQLYAIAAGTGVTYEMLTGDLSQVNFSSARTGMLEFRRAAEQRQWHVLVPRLLAHVWRAFVDAAVLAGKIPRPDYSVEWTTPKWDYVNPMQDVKSDIAEVSGGLSSLSEKLRKRGYQPDAVFKEMGEDYQRLKESGAIDMLRLLMTNGKSEDPAPEPVTTPPDPAGKRSEDEMHQMQQMHRQTIETLLASNVTHSNREQPAPAQITTPVTVELKTDRIDQAIDRMAEAHIEQIRAIGSEMPINITLPEQPAPIVHVHPEIVVKAPDVLIENAVPSAQVLINGPKTSTQKVERDANDEIVQTVTTHTYA